MTGHEEYPPPIPRKEKGVANGVATLDGDGEIPVGQLPSEGSPPSVHATEHELGGDDEVNHDSLLGYEADEHLPRDDAATDDQHVWSAQKVKAEVDALASGASRRSKVIDYVDASAAPPTEVEGDRYILDDSTPVDAGWDGASNLSIVEFDGASWVEHTPSEGWITYVDDENQDRQYVDDGAPEWESRPPNTLLHEDLTDVTSDQHHPKSHAHDGLDGSGTVAHSDLTGIAADDHHAKYTDPEAVAAMGAKAAGNPLNHDRYTDGEADARAAAAVTTHETTYDHTKLHDRLHGIDSVADHSGVAGATEDNLLSFNSAGLPQDSGVSPSDISDEIDTDIATHAAIADAHHAKYTDGEAVTAMGAKDDGNPLNHDRPTDFAGAGTTGLVPDPSTETGKVLDDSGTWVDPSADDPDAIHDDVAGEINAIASKATPVAGDVLLIEDSEASFAKKKTTWADLMAVGGEEGTTIKSSSEAENLYLGTQGDDTSDWQQVQAAHVGNTPAGGIAATDVQAAINELDTEKASTTHASTHSAGGSDEVNVEDLGSGGSTAGQLLQDDGDGTVSWATKVILSVLRWAGYPAVVPGNGSGYIRNGESPLNISSIENYNQLHMPACEVVSIRGEAVSHSSNLTLTVRKNGADTTLTGTITADGVFEMTGSGPITFADGDLLSIAYSCAAGGGCGVAGLCLEISTEVS